MISPNKARSTFKEKPHFLRKTSKNTMAAHGTPLNSLRHLPGLHITSFQNKTLYGQLPQKRSDPEHFE